MSRGRRMGFCNCPMSQNSFSKGSKKKKSSSVDEFIALCSLVDDVVVGSHFSSRCDCPASKGAILQNGWCISGLEESEEIVIHI
jgi:hypothetical protein